jgi:radical SAM protein with 4Fe4S-binding SPASM domain
MKDIYAYFESLNIPFAAVLAYKSRNIDDSCIYDGKLDFFEEQYKILLNFYTSRIKNKLPINCYSIMNDIQLLKRHETKNYSCAGGVNLFAITDNGNIFSCEHLAFHEKYKIGNINSGIDNKALSKMQPQNVNGIAGCEKCWVKYLCAGGCFSEKILTGQYTKTLSEDECRLKRLYWDFIINLYVISQTMNLYEEDHIKN